MTRTGLTRGPRRIAEVLDEALDVYQANARTILTAAAIILLPAGLIAGVAQNIVVREFIGMGKALIDGDTGALGTMTLQLSTWLAQAAAGLVLLARLFFFSMVLAAGPAMLAGSEFTTRQFIRAGSQRFLPLVLVTFLVGVMTELAVGASLLLLILPALFVGPYIWAALSVAGPACVVEDASADQALRRSRALTRGRFWRVVGFALALMLVQAGLELAVASPGAVRGIIEQIRDGAILTQPSLGWTVIDGLLQGAAFAIVGPFVNLAWLIFYLDLRVRAEGMDLMVRADEV